MILEIIEQALLRSDSRVFIKGIEGIWEPEIHTLRLLLDHKSKVEVDEYEFAVFPLVINYSLDNDENFRPLFKLRKSPEERNLYWDLSEDGIKHIIDVVFPDDVVADIVLDTTSSNSLTYLESNGRLINGSYFDLLSDEDISKFADRKSWYRYVRVSSDKNLTSAQHIDKDGKIISQEYIYYKYTGLKAFFEGGSSRCYNLDPSTLYLRLSGYAERDKYCVKGDDHIFLCHEVVHIKEVPGLEINPRSREREVFSGRINYSSFALYTGYEEGEDPFITDSPRSFNFISYTAEGERLISNNVVFSGGSVTGDVWEYLDASTDLDYRIEERPVFFISEESKKISFTIWNSFRENVLYDLSNVALTGDIASHFKLDLVYWSKGEWTKDNITRRGALTVNLTSDGEKDLNGVLSLIDTEDQTIITKIEVRTLDNKVQDSIFLTNPDGSIFSGMNSENTSSAATVYTLGISDKYETLYTKFLSVCDLDNGYTKYQGYRATIECSLPAEGSDRVVGIKDAVFLGDNEEINMSLYPGKSIILYNSTTYYLLNPAGGFVYPSGDTSLIQDTKPRYSRLTVSSGVREKDIAYYLSGVTDKQSVTKVYFVEKATGSGISLLYDGLRQQEDKRLLFGYLLVGFDLSSIKSALETAKIFPIYTLPNVKYGCSLYTLYDRNEGVSDGVDSSSEVVSALSTYTIDKRNLILGTGKTWIDLQLPQGYYINEDEQKVFKTYRINPIIKISPSSEYISFDLEKWRSIYGTSDYIETKSIYWDGTDYYRPKIKLPIEIKKLPRTGIVSVSLRISIGEENDLPGTYLDITFKLGQEVKSVNIEDSDAIDGKAIIYETPVNTYVPGKVYSRAGLKRVSGLEVTRTTVDFGPAFASPEYSDFGIKRSKFTSFSLINDSNVGIYRGELVRDSGGDTFSFSNTKKDVELVKLVKRKSEYDGSNKSRYIPETREYEITYRIPKLDDKFPQYPSSKLSIRLGQMTKDVYLFYMPGNPYVLATAAKKQYIYISPSVRSAWDTYKNSGGTRPSLITGTFYLDSGFFDVNSNLNGTSYSLNAANGERYLETRLGRYLTHLNGEVSEVFHGDRYAASKAFTNLTLSPESDGTTALNYELDLSKWNGSEAAQNNCLAEVFVKVPTSSVKSIFPSNISSIIGFTPSWSYSNTDYQVKEWNEAYLMANDRIDVPGNQRVSSAPYIRIEEQKSGGTWTQTSYLALRCQIRGTKEEISSVEDISVSCYGGDYPWVVPGSFEADSGFIFVNPSMAKIKNTTQESGKTTANVSILPSTFLDPISLGTAITEDLYKTRKASVYTNEPNAKCLNIEQQPPGNYFYYRHSQQGSVPKVYCGNQTVSSGAPVSESYSIGNGASEMVFYFEYLETVDLAEYISQRTNSVFFSDFIQAWERDRIDWTEDELGIEIIGDLDVSYSADVSYVDETLGKVGKITLSFGENTAETSRAGVFKLYRRDNAGVLIEFNISQAGESVVSLFSGSINSAGDGRLWVYSEYPASSMEISGASDCVYLGNYLLSDETTQAQAYSLKFPANSIPRILDRGITISSEAVPGKISVISLSQGYFGMKARRGDGVWSEAAEDGLYVFGSLEKPESFDTKYYLCHSRLEPKDNDEFGQETEIPFDINRVEIDSIQYQIAGSGTREYDVSDVFSSVSTDIVYSGTVSDSYPYIHTVGTIYEDKKELGLCLVTEITVSLGYESKFVEYSYYDDSGRQYTSQPYSNEVRAINKIQIWYKI